MVTDLLEAVGLGLFVVAAFVYAGAALAFAVAGACCLVASFAVTRK